MRSLLLGLGCLWLRTLRVRWILPGNTQVTQLPGADAPGRGVIVLWHEHLPMCIRAFAHRGIHVLISQSRDGSWAADACSRFGYAVHRGSSSRPSAAGLRPLARALRAPHGLIGMALDGPRGPRRAPKPGSLRLAREAGAPVIPVWVEASRAFRLGTWDRCVVPWPFARVEVRLGTPFHPQNEGEIAKAMEALEGGGEPEQSKLVKEPAVF